MKLMVFFTVLSITASAIGNAQQRITMNEQGITLRKVFSLIERQTGVAVAANEKFFNDTKPVTVAVTNMALEDFLNLILKDQPLLYRLSGNTIILKRKQEKKTGADIGSIVDETKQQVITGVVKDAEGNFLPGATIANKSSKTNTSSDAAGRFSINANTGDIISVSFVGYLSISVRLISVENNNLNIAVAQAERQPGSFDETIDNNSPIQSKTSAAVSSDQQLNFSLLKRIDEMQEVIVNKGYYTESKKLSTGSTVKITAKDIERQPVTSPIMALQGRVPGLEIIPSSGAPGIAPQIRIRGINSLRQGPNTEPQENGNYPLYIIDGVPINSMPINSWTGSFTSGGYDPLSAISPANIESIEVLKDGDATAIYGSRGANGVIVITTKRNSKFQERTTAEANVYTGVGKLSKTIDLLNTKQYLAMRYEAIANENMQPGEGQYDFDLIHWDTTRQTNWQKLLLGNTANLTDVQANIYSGTNRTSFRLTAGYHKETLIFPGDFGFQRISTQFSLNHASANQKFKIGFAATYGLTISKMFGDGGGMLEAALTLPPNAPELYNSDGSLNWEQHDLGTGTLSSTWVNPFSYLQNSQNTNSSNLISTINASYSIFKNLITSVNAGYTVLNSNEVGKLPVSARQPESPGLGITNFNTTAINTWIIEPKLQFTEKINEHSFDVVLGGTWQNNLTKFLKIGAEKYASDALLGSLEGAGLIRIASDGTFQYKYNSIYARLGYNWSEKYIINLTGRRDGSSRFGSNNRFGNFGAIGMGWIFYEENFLQWLKPILSFGKVRASYGITGNDLIGDYKYYNLYRLSPDTYGGSTAITPSALYNPDFAWEVTRKVECAIEMSFANNRIGFELNWFRNRSSNQLINYSLPNMTGFPSVLTNFNATVQNTGWEIILRADLLRSSAWSWDVSLNASLPTNKLIKFDGIKESPYVNQYEVNKPLDIKWLYTWNGVNSQTGLYDIEDKNKDGKINDNDRMLYDLIGIRYFGGFNNAIRYKGLKISLFFQFSHQQGLRFISGATPGDLARNQSIDFLSRWQYKGDKTEIQKYGTNNNNELFFAQYRTVLSNRNSVDASFVRLKTASISYQFTGPWLER